MTERWVINASPIILLAKAEVIHLLPKLCQQLIIPQGVVTEIERGQAADAGRQWLSLEGTHYVHPSPEIQSEVARWRGGPGEAEVISWALLDRGFKVVLDDGRARRMAQSLGLTVLGSLGIIVRAKKTGLVTEARPFLQKLRGAGAFVSDDLIDLAIAEAGE